MDSFDYKPPKSMEGVESGNSGSSSIQRAFGSSSSGTAPRPLNRLNASSFIPSQMGASAILSHQNMSPENLKPGIPPSHPNIPPSMPYPQIVESQSASQQLRSPNMRPRASHSRSLSQHSFFSLDGLPPLSPSLYSEPSPTAFSNSISPDLSMKESVVNSHVPSISLSGNWDHALQVGHSVLPRKGHRRSSSDTPLGISGFLHSSPQLAPSAPWMDLDNPFSRGGSSGFEKPIPLVRRQEPKEEEGNADYFNSTSMVEKKEESLDDLISVYMNLENIDTLNPSGADDSKTFESSDNEVESHGFAKINPTQGATSSSLEDRKEGNKRSSSGEIAPGGRHRRSFSLDSSIGNLYLEDESPKLPSMGSGVGQGSPGSSIDGKTSDINMDFGNGEFSEVELKKIMESDKLAEIALSDPKRAKRYFLSSLFPLFLSIYLNLNNIYSLGSYIFVQNIG